MLSQQPSTALQWVTGFLGLMHSVLQLGFMSEPWGAPESLTRSQQVGEEDGATSRSRTGAGFPTRWEQLSWLSRWRGW